jgi:hypothetical protein
MHNPAEPCIAERILYALIPALIREDIIPEAVMLKLADDLDEKQKYASVDEGDALEAMACQLRVWAIEAAGPTEADRREERRRKRLRVIKGRDEA